MSEENAQFSLCQAEKTGAKSAALENQSDIKVFCKMCVSYQLFLLFSCTYSTLKIQPVILLIFYTLLWQVGIS